MLLCIPLLPRKPNNGEHENEMNMAMILNNVSQLVLLLLSV